MKGCGGNRHVGTAISCKRSSFHDKNAIGRRRRLEIGSHSIGYDSFIQHL